ncbi:MAG: ATP-binding protein [Deltaproteobacteria bacterium]|nr:ATP-binding protein [Deltaproteobacteria bacterium]
MWKLLSLRTRVLLLLFALVLISVGGGLTSMFHSYIMDKVFSSVIESDIEALQAAQELEAALVMQKGYVTYYFQDGDPDWLDELEKHHLGFESWLRRARQWAVTDAERAVLNEIDSEYIRYCYSRDEVINLYKEGKREAGYKLHRTVRTQFFKIIQLCRKFKELYEQSILAARQKIRDRVSVINASTLVALLLAVVLAFVLGYILFKEILGPIRQLAIETDARKIGDDGDNEVKALSRRFHNLIDDVDQAKTKLKWSREHLQQVEKWALVGKLAAGVAHSVRNPLTSVKMRLFSMERTLALSLSQKEDFEVISEEIRHIDTIVGNFLEFSRPPKLKMQRISPSDTVDMAVQLLRHRLESYEVKVEVKREGRLREIQGDPDQLKEVFVNLMLNACEAMVDGGSIVIQEDEGASDALGSVAIIRVSDDGPGVPEPIQEKLFQPFFSTKEEGTGLGLSIVARIVEEHGGWIDLKSREGEGATFVITLPKGEKESWAKSL